MQCKTHFRDNLIELRKRMVMAMSFNIPGIKCELIKALKMQGIEEPIGIQRELFETILENKEVIAQSQTGSGKTLGYLLPIYQRQSEIEKGLQVLILVPTHELGMQVFHQIELLSKNSGIQLRCAAAFGNANIQRQIEQLKLKPQIVVGTTGRVLELIKIKKLLAHLVNTIVVDEADKLFDKNNANSTLGVIKCCLRDTQLVLISASISQQTIDRVRLIPKEPVIIKAEQESRIPENIEHIYLTCDERDKAKLLNKLIYAIKPKKALAFIDKSEDMQITTEKLKFNKISAGFIHGGEKKEERKKAIDDIKDGRIQILLATDIAARGLHIDDVDVVFNVTCSDDVMNYLHRAGRTGRGGKKGLCVSLVSPRELPLIKRYERALGIEIKERGLFEGRISDTVKNRLQKPSRPVNKVEKGNSSDRHYKQKA